MSTASADAKRRVKLYVLNASRQWDDKGTGHITSCYHEPLDGMSLLVQNETDGSLLLESKIQLDTQYQKQQGTLIVWTESDNYDLALSFQDRDGCDEIWAKICQVQGRNPLHYEIDNDDEQEEVRINLVECDQDKLHLILDQITAFSLTNRKRDTLAAEYIENDYIGKLLELFRKADEIQDIDTLHKLYEIFKQLFLYDRPTLTEVMLSEPFLMDVIGVFEYEPQNEETSETTTTTSQFETTNVNNDDLAPTHTTSNDKNNNNHDDDDHDVAHSEDVDDSVKSITEEMKESVQEVSDEIKLDRTDEETRLEQKQPEEQQDKGKEEEEDSNSPNEQESSNETPMIQQKPKQEFLRKRHREFLLNGTSFKEVIPFCNQKLVDKIHQTYRVQYLQSSVLPTPSILEENAYNALNNILFFNKVEIVTMIQENEEFLQTLFNQIISSETGVERKRELVKFLREYCIFSQTIQPKQRENFFKTLTSLKILSAVEVALSSSDSVIKSAAIDIFTYLVEFSPHMTREHAVQQREGIIDPPNSNAQTANILKLVIEHITTDRDPELGTATQLSCIIRIILDPENMSGDDIAKHSFLEFFYYTCMQSLLEPIKNATTPNGDILPSADDRKTAQLLSIMMELLTFFIEHHYGQLRKCILSSDLLSRIVSLIKSRHKFLVLSK